MTLDTLTSILVLIAPALASIMAIVTGFLNVVKVIKGFKNDSDKIINNFEIRNKKAYDDIATIKTKLASIEQYLMDKEDKKWVKKE